MTSRKRKLEAQESTEYRAKGPRLGSEMKEQKLLHRFKDLGYIGGGCNGIVHKIANSQGVNFALKKTHISDENPVEKLVTEAKLHSREYPGVLSCKLWWKEDRSICMITELCNETVAKYIHGDTAMEYSRVILWAKNMLTGLTELQYDGVMHCDLKPANILVKSDGSVVIADLGQAQDVNDQKEKYGSTTTWHYWAPEMNTSNASRRSDVYSIGIILAELMLGRVFKDGEIKMIQEDSAYLFTSEFWLLSNECAFMSEILSKMIVTNKDKRWIAYDILEKWDELYEQSMEPISSYTRAKRYRIKQAQKLNDKWRKKRKL